MDKPKKILHNPEIRKKLFSDMKNLLKEIFDCDERIKEISVFGSAQNKEFGKYIEKYKPGTPTEREFSDIDCVFLLDKLNEDKIILKNGMILEDSRFVLDENNEIVEIGDHPIMCGVLTSKENFYDNLNKPYPEGYDYTKSRLILFER